VLHELEGLVQVDVAVARKEERVVGLEAGSVELSEAPLNDIVRQLAAEVPADDGRGAHPSSVPGARARHIPEGPKLGVGVAASLRRKEE
jgi:hypothetical protein